MVFKLCENCKKRYLVSKGRSYIQKYCCKKCGIRYRAYVIKQVRKKAKSKKVAKELLKKHKHKRRALLKGNGGSYTVKEIMRLIKKANGVCKGYQRNPHYVGKNNLAIDHIKPISRGGNSNISNIQLLCKSCNSSKSNKY